MPNVCRFKHLRVLCVCRRGAGGVYLQGLFLSLSLCRNHYGIIRRRKHDSRDT